MSNFYQAIKWLKEGKKVRRSSYSNKEWYLFSSEEPGEIGFIYLHHTKLHKPKIHSFNLELFEANDWEIYEEPKESLSDHICKTADVIPTKDVKKSIQNIQNKILFARNKIYSKFSGHFTNHNTHSWNNPLDGLDFALEEMNKEFGEKLL